MLSNVRRHVTVIATVLLLSKKRADSDEGATSCDDENLLKDDMTREQIAAAYESLSNPAVGESSEIVVREFKDHHFKLVKRGKVVEYQCTCAGCKTKLDVSTLKSINPRTLWLLDGRLTRHVRKNHKELAQSLKRLRKAMKPAKPPAAAAAAPARPDVYASFRAQGAATKAEKFKNALVVWSCAKGIPFNAFASDEFKEVVRTLDPTQARAPRLALLPLPLQLHFAQVVRQLRSAGRDAAQCVPARKQLASGVDDLYKTRLEACKKRLANVEVVSVSHDVWTHKDERILGMHATFLDEQYNVKELLLGLKRMATATAPEIAQEIDDACKSCLSESCVILWTTADGAESSVADPDAGTCIDHIINLCMKSGADVRGTKGLLSRSPQVNARVPAPYPQPARLFLCLGLSLLPHPCR